MTSLDQRSVSVRQRPPLQAQLSGSHPADLAETLPARWYSDPAIWQRERWPIFASNLDAGNYNVGVLSPKWEYALGVFHGMIRDAVGPID